MLANIQLFGGTNKGAPRFCIFTFMQSGFNMGDRRAALTGAIEARRNNPRIIDHQHIARAQKSGRSRTNLSAKCAPTTSIRALSRGKAGRKATRSSGSSKSNRSTRKA